MNPDAISTLPVFDNLIRKCLVDFHIIHPGVIFVCLALWVIGDLIMENGPKNLFAVMSVVCIKITILAEHRQRVVFCSETVLDILLLLGILQSVSWHTQCSNPDLVMKLSTADRCFNGISEASIALICWDYRPVGMGKDPVMAITSFKLGLADTCPTKLYRLFSRLVMFQNIGRRERAGACLRLIKEAPRAPRWGVWVTRRNIGELGEVRVQFGILLLSKEFIVIDFCTWCLRRCDVPLSEETGFRLRFDPRRSMPGSSGSCVTAILRRGRKLEVYGVGEKTVVDFSQRFSTTRSFQEELCEGPCQWIGKRRQGSAGPRVLLLKL